MASELTEDWLKDLQKLLSEGTEPRFDARRGFLAFMHTVLGGERIDAVSGELEQSGRMVKGRIVVLSEHLLAVVDVEGLGSIHTQIAGDTEPITVEVIPRRAVTSAAVTSPGWTERWPFEGPDFEQGTTVTLSFGTVRGPVEVAGPGAAVTGLYHLVLDDLARR